jgi:5-methylthioadenosine/S-adenosylhomocysteine deaminase
VAGKALLNSGELTTLNEDTLRQQTQYWQQQIANA